MRRGSSERSGLLIVDKPPGCTSHDVVQRVRKALGQKSVGHAGTLDPLATGVLVVAVGEGTKLVSHLQSDDKRYEVTIALGAETDSLDADGEITERAEVPQLDVGAVEDALRPFLGKHPQQAPKLSAIKVGGRPLHRRARKGEAVEAPVREVELFDAEVESVTPTEIALRLHCGKGFYVRSLARDLALALGTRGHVRTLRRTASGRFGLERAVYGDGMTAESIAERLIPLRDACAPLPRVDLTDAGAEHAHHGRPIGPDDVVGDAWREAGEAESLALFAPNGEPVALGRRVDDNLRVVRGFRIDREGVVSP
jgi:tRNA pseudouridine55 synthase